MANCGCHCCRFYGENQCDERHRKSEVVRAKHRGDGWYTWGRWARAAKGRWVKICKGCRDFALTESA